LEAFCFDIKTIMLPVGRRRGTLGLLTAQFEEENVMASNPEIPTPDTVNPQSPAEIPVSPPPEETPFSEPPEIVPETPNIDEPDRAPSELPPPPD
jgi:hypothetical protein